MAKENGGTSAKAFSGVVAIIAVIAGVFAMTEPMGQRVDFLEQQIAEVRHNMCSDNARELRDASTLATLTANIQMAKEGLGGVDKRLLRVEDWQSWWTKNMPTLDAEQDIRLDHLEKKGP